MWIQYFGACFMRFFFWFCFVFCFVFVCLFVCFLMDTSLVFLQNVLTTIFLMEYVIRIVLSRTRNECWAGYRFAHGCHNPVRGGICSPAVGIKNLTVWFDKVPLPFSACSVPKEKTAEAIVACVVTVNLCMAYSEIWSSTQVLPTVIFFSLLCFSKT